MQKRDTTISKFLNLMKQRKFWLFTDDVIEIHENIAIDAIKRHTQIEVVEFHDVTYILKPVL